MARLKNKRKKLKTSMSKNGSFRDPQCQPSSVRHRSIMNNAIRFHQTGQLVEAENLYRSILNDDPTQPDALHLLGVIASQVGKHDLAIHLIQQAITISPKNSIYYNNLGHVFKRLDQLDNAISCYEKALQIQPEYPDALSQLVHLLQQTCAWQKLDGLSEKLDGFTQIALNSGTKPAESPYINVTRHADPDLNFKVAKLWADNITRHTSKLDLAFSFHGRRRNKSKIVVGYLSNDFRHHPTAHLTLSLFGLHHRQEFRIYGYSYGIDDGSCYREQIRGDCDKFMDLRHLSFADAARRIYADQVDILVDLMGHIAGNRLEICALRPAPIQVSY
ncbi:MAG: tetratricopeptide repeat protein, partial [Desulfobacterales bacterium]